MKAVCIHRFGGPVESIDITILVDNFNSLSRARSVWRLQRIATTIASSAPAFGRPRSMKYTPLLCLL